MSYPLGNIDIKTFLAEYWQKKPVLIRNAFPDFSPIIEADELAGLACEEDVESRLIQFSANADKWSLKNGPFGEDDFAALPESHWTLLVQAVDHWVPEAADLLNRFNFIPNWRVDDLMISYASQGGGVGPHYDNYDVFLIQAAGTRRWELGPLCDENSPRRDDAPVMILPEWDADTVYELEPGDMLYLPPRVAHNGIAVTDNCQTYSVGFRAPGINEMLRSFSDFAGERLSNDQRYDDPDLSLQAQPGEMTAQSLDKVQALLCQFINDRALLGEWFGRYTTEPKYPEQSNELPEPIDAQEIADALNEGSAIVRNEGSRFTYIETADEVQLFVDGELYRCAPVLLEFIQLLTNHRLLSLASNSLNPDTLELITKLLNQGIVYID